MAVYLLYISFIVFLGLQIYLCHRSPLCGIIFFPGIIVFFSSFLYGQQALAGETANVEGGFFNSLATDALVFPVLAFYLSTVLTVGLSAAALFFADYDTQNGDERLALIWKKIKTFYWVRRIMKLFNFYCRLAHIITAKRIYRIQKSLEPLIVFWQEKCESLFRPIEETAEELVLK